MPHSLLKFCFVTVKLLTKPSCSACQTGTFILGKIKSSYPSVTYLKCDISEDKRYKEYLNRVPVILIDEEMVCEMRIDQVLIEDRLREKTERGI